MASNKPRRRASQSSHAPVAPRPLWAMAWSKTHGVRTLTSIEEFTDAYAEEGSRIWIDLQDPPKELLLELGDTLGLHPLITEDILEQNQRAKLEITDETLHVVLF